MNVYKYLPKIKQIEAVYWLGDIDHINVLNYWLSVALDVIISNNNLIIRNQNGIDIIVNPGEYIIKQGNNFVCLSYKEFTDRYVSVRDYEGYGFGEK